MKALLRLSAAAALGFLLYPGTAMSDITRQGDAEQQLVRAVTGFSAGLYREVVRGEQKNVLISPISVHLVLAALGSGAHAGTKTELLGALKLEDFAAGGQAYASLLKKLNSPPAFDGNSPAYTLSLANAAWIKKDYAIKSGFRDTLQQNFDAKLAAVNFADAPRAAAEINKWVAEKTGGRIKDLISAANIDPLTRLVLTNAVYFKSRWQNQFEKRVTKEAPFYTAPDRTVQVQLMNDIQSVPYYEDGETQVLSLPYYGSTLSMVIVLPRDKAGLNKIEEKLSAGVIQQWLETQQAVRVDYYLPRFSFSGRLQLNGMLKALGVSEAFDQHKAAFPGIMEQEKLWLSLVLHQGFIAVDEEGTEAAAATALMMVGSGIPTGEPQEFRADHPFLFFIVHEPTKAILFMGRVVDPAGK